MICNQTCPKLYFSQIHRVEHSHNILWNRIQGVFDMPSLLRSIFHYTVSIGSFHSDQFFLMYRDTPLSLYESSHLQPQLILAHRRYRDCRANYHHYVDLHILPPLTVSRETQFHRSHSQEQQLSHSGFHPYNTR